MEQKGSALIRLEKGREIGERGRTLWRDLGKGCVPFSYPGRSLAAVVGIPLNIPIRFALDLVSLSLGSARQALSVRTKFSKSVGRCVVISSGGSSRDSIEEHVVRSALVAREHARGFGGDHAESLIAGAFSDGIRPRAACSNIDGVSVVGLASLLALQSPPSLR